MFLLDTNHCSKIINRDGNCLSKLSEYKNEKFMISSVVCGELYFMAGNSEYEEANLAKVKNFINNIDILDVDNDVAEIYGKLKAKLYNILHGDRRRRKKEFKKLNIYENDLWIAATAIKNDLTIISSDSDYNNISRAHPLRTESWVNPPATGT